MLNFNNKHSHTGNEKDNNETYYMLTSPYTFHTARPLVGIAFLTFFGSVNTGDCAAMSIPAINPLTIIELPPADTNGIVTPVNGMRLHEPKIFSAI